MGCASVDSEVHVYAILTCLRRVNLTVKSHMVQTMRKIWKKKAYMLKVRVIASWKIFAATDVQQRYI